MNSKLKAIGIAALAGLIGIAGVAPAVARQPLWIPHGHARMHYSHRGYHPGFQRHYAPNYSYSPGYYPGYYGYGYGYDPGGAIVGGLIGGVFGTIAGEALAHGGHGHVWRCEHAYRTYVPATNTFTGNDGRRHICRL
jgi:hypothetical protein